MVSSHVSTLVARPPIVAFSQQTLTDFEELIKGGEALALMPNDHSHLKMILEDDS